MDGCILCVGVHLYIGCHSRVTRAIFLLLDKHTHRPFPQAFFDLVVYTGCGGWLEGSDKWSVHIKEEPYPSDTFQFHFKIELPGSNHLAIRYHFNDPK